MGIILETGLVHRIDVRRFSVRGGIGYVVIAYSGRDVTIGLFINSLCTKGSGRIDEKPRND